MNATADSPRAIAARANGAKSRGPKTEEGKQRSSQNALKHGFSAAKYICLPDDEEGAFEKFAQGILNDLNPIGSFQEALAEEVISCMWRIRRIPIFEATLVSDERATFHHTRVKFFRHDWYQAHLGLARYEAHLTRCLHKALSKLEALQSKAAQQSEEPPSPLENKVLQNKPKRIVWDADELIRQSLEEHPQERKKTTAEVLDCIRTRKRR